MAADADAVICPVRNNLDVIRSAPYVACQKATGVDFQNSALLALDATEFCSNTNCYILWKQVADLGALDCFKRYNVTDGYRLKKADSSKRCFRANGILTVAVTPTDEAPDAATNTPTPTDTLLTKTPKNSEPSTSAANAISSPVTENPAVEPPPPSLSDTMTSSSPSSSSTTGQSKQSTSASIVIGSSAAAIVLVAVLLVFLSIHRRESRGTSSEGKEIATLDDGGVYVRTLHTSRSRDSDSGSLVVLSEGRSSDELALPSSRGAVWEDDVINAVRIPYEKVTKNKLISRGGYGEVFRGLYRNRVVAIKCLLPERRNDMRQIENFLEEIKLMVALEHEHIVRFIGVAWDSLNELCAVTEYMPRGDLRAFLALYEASENAPPSGFNPDKIKIALHVANALTYMHSLQPVVLHRDLKSRNILLDAALNAKLTDFGVSREQVDNTMTIGVGSSLWMAPEVMTGGYYDEKADVFSFGVVLSELDTHRLPYSHAVEPGRGRKLPDTVIVQMVATSRISVEFSYEKNSPLARLGRRCVSLDPAERPTAAELQHALHQIH